jgi:hypothetical protein
VPKRARRGLRDVASGVEPGTSATDWVQQEFASADLADGRLNRRLIKTASQLANSPASPINEACGDWASTQAAYRFFNNTKVSAAAILKPHLLETVKRLRAQAEVVLVVQDTVFFSYGKHPNTRGLGPIGKGTHEYDRGLIMHNALAFSACGVPLGLLSQRIWVRKDVVAEGYQEKIERLQCTPIEEKESSKWLLGLRETIERVPRGVKLITVADRESDFFEFITEAETLGALFLIRACGNRLLIPEDSDGSASMLEAIADASVIGALTVDIPGSGKRKARTARVEVRIAEVTLKPPHRRARAKTSGSTDPVRVHVIAATERDAPEGCEALSWVLLTNLPIKSFAGATEKIQWYSRRWGIEIWHKVLKSGCKVEDCQLEAADRLKRYLTLFSIIGVRLMHVAHLARAQPEAHASEVFCADEIEALHLRVNKSVPRATQPPTLRETVRMLGRLGGHLGRKSDGEPGLTVLWRGWQRLYEDVEMLRAYKRSLGRMNSS